MKFSVEEIFLDQLEILYEHTELQTSKYQSIFILEADFIIIMDC